MSPNVGFIGLGTMGRPMAANLVKAGYRLTVYDVDGAAVEALVNQGALAANSAREVAEASEVIVSMLPASQHSLAAASGPDGYIAGLSKGSTVIDMSTIDPDTTRQIADAVAAAGGAMLDAPVSGSSAWATTGELTIMVGGAAAVLEQHRDLLGHMGTNVIHCGAIGMGETVKLANNLVAGISMIAVTEAFALGVAKGADPKVLFDVMSKASGNCWTLQTRCPAPGVVSDSPVNDGFAPGFMADLMYKDLGLALAAASQEKVPLALTAIAHEQYAATSRRGFGRLDFSAVAKLLDGATG
jgi:3-hydroxyisobutyrate dehydrogenase